MRLLLEYMYLGSISVAQSDLAEILRTAYSLKIRGLTTAEPPTEDLEDTFPPPLTPSSTWRLRPATAPPAARAASAAVTHTTAAGNLPSPRN